MYKVYFQLVFYPHWNVTFFSLVYNKRMWKRCVYLLNCHISLHVTLNEVGHQLLLSILIYVALFWESNETLNDWYWYFLYNPIKLTFITLFYFLMSIHYQEYKSIWLVGFVRHIDWPKALKNSLKSIEFYWNSINSLVWVDRINRDLGFCFPSISLFVLFCYFD